MIYVMADIHGHEARYRDILRQIQLTGKDHLYVLGDCIDRNPDGLTILHELAQKPNVTLMLGNHELMMLEALSHPEDKQPMYLWYRNGGYVTHEQFLRGTEASREETLALLRSLPYSLETECNGIAYLLVHGAPVGYRNRYNNPAKDSVWTRMEWFWQMPEGKTVIFGHTPTQFYRDISPLEIYFGDRMIGIDCGCAYPQGRLACLRLDDMQAFYSSPGL